MMPAAFGDSIALALAILLASSAISKLRHGASFLASLRAYKLVPPGLLTSVAILLVVLETALAVGLIFFRGATVTFGVAGLFILYAAAVLVNILRGNTNIDCGCQFGDAAQPISPWLVVRNAWLAVLSLLLLAPSDGRPIDTVHYLVVFFATVTFSLFYLSCNQLIANWIRMQRMFQ